MTDTPSATGPAPSGVDLARAAFHQARLAAQTQPARTAPRPPRPRRHDGREPVTAAAAFTGLMDSRGWAAPTAAASLTDQWPTIAPELDGKVTPASFNPDTGRLDLQPTTPAYATQLRLLQHQMIKRINTALGTETVRALRVLPPRATTSAPATTAAVPSPTPPGDDTPVPAHPSYLQALTAVRASQRPRTPSPAAQAALEQQARHRTVEPEEAFTDAVHALQQELARRAAQNDPFTTARARARARAAAERAGTPFLPARRAGTPLSQAPVERTA
ncbi:DUF721 domain-containing protein [Streptomyces sp. TRM 70351]|uniref:DUF721 domain-containing protein n=1 Tax=Streptomyces sp. TRM 70351 TaxID=3116552 RepID=UPI002E7BE59E|nr:DUF721 domain-containing protein [Streptomyces sp. TRM 70351]MEE1931422.1 DUF721 domain-containing protein [Streptomyces sp. TRM 70351]